MAENKGKLNIAEIIKDVFKDFISFSLSCLSLSRSFSTSISALNPTFSIALTKSASSKTPEGYSTTALLVAKFTEELTTPSIFSRALPTLLEQEAQVIPSTNRVFFTKGTPYPAFSITTIRYSSLTYVITEANS